VLKETNFKLVLQTCNLSVGIGLNAQFTTNGICAKNNTHTYVAQTSVGTEVVGYCRGPY